MRKLLTLFCILIPFVATADTEANRIAALVGSCDTVRIHGELNKSKESIVSNKNWIKSVSAAVASSPIDQRVRCMCAGWRTAYFYKNNQLVVSIAAVHGNQLRIYTSFDKDDYPIRGGDYPIEETSWALVADALKYPKQANKSE